MNIFVLDTNPVKCAQMHCDKHVVKMVLETAQILSTAAQRLKETQIDGLYKPTHINHPCTKWVMESFHNYKWLLELGSQLAEEYEYRYNKVHKSLSVILASAKIELLNDFPESKGMTPFAQAMPEKYKNKDSVKAYRNYYMNEKAHIAVWTGRDIPTWWEGE